MDGDDAAEGSRGSSLYSLMPSGSGVFISWLCTSARRCVMLVLLAGGLAQPMSSVNRLITELDDIIKLFNSTR